MSEARASVLEPFVVALDPAALRARTGYVPLRPGVEILYLYNDEKSGAAAALLRYEPGATVPAHEHQGYEHVFVLSGAQSDARGRYGEGVLLINPPGTSHRVVSEEGCLVLVVWQRPVRFLEPFEVER
jgi:anti-sigma factor ChrR (cupin superfamily)